LLKKYKCITLHALNGLCFCSNALYVPTLTFHLSFVAGILVILSLQFFTPYFYYIPKASLAAVIIAAVVFMVEFHVVKPMWRTKSK
jgi:hypothetical protein